MTRFEVLKQRHQRPFHEGRDRGGSNYTLDQAFRLRLLLDLLGGDAGDASMMAGLGPSYAVSVVFNAMTKFPRHPLNQIDARDWYLGVVV